MPDQGQGDEAENEQDEEGGKGDVADIPKHIAALDAGPLHEGHKAAADDEQDEEEQRAHPGDVADGAEWAGDERDESP